MATRLETFLNDVRSAREQQAAERLDRLQQLKAMTPEEFVRLPREELQDITNTEYSEIVRQIAPDHRLPKLQETPKHSSQWWTSLRRIAVPISLRAALLGLIAGLLVLIASLAIGPGIDWWQYLTPPIRTVNATRWPSCMRLSAWVDGCVYTPATNLGWDRAADLLQMSEIELRRNNRHIHNQTYIPRRTMLIVWRDRGELQETVQ
jgi:hypothetical protein